MRGIQSATFTARVGAGIAFTAALVGGPSLPSAYAQGTIVPEVDQQKQQPQPAPSSTSSAPAATTAQPAPSATAGATSTPAPAQQAPVYAAAPPVPVVPAQGQWVYTDQYGWIWVPEGSTTVYVQEQPYVYLYTPVYGWTWYGSPWGPGRYYYGPWVHHVWGAPRVWHRGAWFAPRIVVGPRVGAPRVYYRGGYGHPSGHHGRR